MILVLGVALIIVASALAYAGLVKGELPISKESKATGITAKIIGACCLGVVLLLVAGVVWLISYPPV